MEVSSVLSYADESPRGRLAETRYVPFIFRFGDLSQPPHPAFGLLDTAAPNEKDKKGREREEARSSISPSFRGGTAAPQLCRRSSREKGWQIEEPPTASANDDWSLSFSPNGRRSNGTDCASTTARAGRRTSLPGGEGKETVGGIPRAPPLGRPHRHAHTRAQPSRGSEPRARRRHHTCRPPARLEVFAAVAAAAVAVSVERSAPMEPTGHAAVAAPVDLSRSAAPAGLSAPGLNGSVPAGTLNAPALSAAGLTTPPGLAGAGLSLLPSLYGRAGGAGDYGVPASSGGDATECRLVEYRGERVAAFVQRSGELLLCLPQASETNAFELFLKHLVGGLHTVYTKLKRLGISPIVCNVEQVRILRGLGAIQPGVNRCKLLACRDFDALYRDCTTAR
ncbi:hypothetical protein HPB49_015432 [Dermacentor silvarum]|uniref:Uncharacterized protein n=1 Tax=Dermacentor silvarum TaxID=543639 RepID=A0ACB8CYJ6_DERSI|nr:hypothetical protein HPB49_015432 [Dermacentor silvarum]